MCLRIYELLDRLKRHFLVYACYPGLPSGLLCVQNRSMLVRKIHYMAVLILTDFLINLCPVAGGISGPTSLALEDLVQCVREPKAHALWSHRLEFESQLLHSPAV